MVNTSRKFKEYKKQFWKEVTQCVKGKTAAGVTGVKGAGGKGCSEKERRGV